MQRHYFSKIALYLTVIVMGLFLFQTTAYSAIIRVKPSGNDANPGASWALAKKTVSAAITTASAGDEIWVAVGTYAEHIQIAKELALYGGFAGTETARNQRDWNVNVTVLNGTSTGTVVTITGGVGANTSVDGFTITGGGSDYGGGINVSGSSPTIANNLIKLNVATTYGGGIFCSDSSPSIIFNSILWNFSEDDGGGISCWRNSSPFIANNQIIGNVSNYTDGASDTSVGGGGIFATAADLDGRPHPTAVAYPTIINNVIAANGGDNGAGIRINDLNGGTATLTNNTVVANSGTGIYWQREFSNTSVVISNNVVAFNTWGLQQRGTTSFQIRFNDVYGNSLFDERTDYVALDNQTGVNGNISIDPQLANYKFGNFHLQPGSPCKDTGSTGDVGTGWTDIDGQSRIMGSAVDMGADESDGTVWSTTFPVIHVKPNGNDSLDGLTWATAKKTLGAAIFAAPSTGWEVWVAEGTYSEHIFLIPFVYLYGGFNGTEVSRDSRNVSANRTIIDGGGTKAIVRSVNTGYLVSGLDGFTVQNGGVYTAGGGTNPNGAGGYGGGIYINVSSPLIANNVIRWNSLGLDGALMISNGGGIYSRMSYAVISGNTITENEILDYQAGKGAGIYCSLSGLTIRDNSIAENHSRYGSAIYCISSYPQILNNLIENNAMYNNYLNYLGSLMGAINLELSQGFLIKGNTIKGNTAQEGAGITALSTSAGSILNNIITGNTAADVSSGQGGMGGGIYCEVALSSTDNTYIVNNTITDNHASDPFLGERGGGIVVMLFSNTNKMVIANNIIAFNSSGIYSQMYAPHVVSNNDVFNTSLNYNNLPSGTNDISLDPDFVNRAAGDFHLKSTSPCIDAGSNSAIPIWLTTDFEGSPRIMDGNNNGTYIVDMGAYEFPGPFADTTPPTPNPITWAMSPYGASATSISMVATTATDAGSPPVSYYFHFVSSPTGGTGGSNAGWQSSASYTNSGLQPNHQYGYQVKARDSASTPNETSYSSTVYKYTLANAPGTSSFLNVTQTSIRANWTANGNRSGTEYWCENSTQGTNVGWTSNLYWDGGGLTCDTAYSFRVKARNGDGIEAGWTSLGSQSTAPCSVETVSVPGAPSGPTSGSVGSSYSFTTSDSTTSLGDPVEFQFDWKGDGTVLSTWGAANRSNSWSTPGTYFPRVRARCTLHPSVVSFWSPALTVRILPPAPPVDNPPFGFFDIPVPDSTLSGVVQVGGWALDDVMVTKVELRSNMSFWPYIGDLYYTCGTRPDIKAAYPTYPNNDCAGWGYMWLTNFMSATTDPQTGQPLEGTTHQFYLRIYDTGGHTTDVGHRNITILNNPSPKPFGAIDVPLAGEIVNGPINVMGWALAKGGRKVTQALVRVDGVSLGQVNYGLNWPALAQVFPVSIYPYSENAAYAYSLNTTQFGNGQHALDVVVIDELGNLEGIGSRYIYIQN